MCETVGLELLFNSIKDQLQAKEDCLVAVYHCMLINDGNKCVGSDDEWPEGENESSSELLPDGWNSNSTVYSLRYVDKDRTVKYLLKIVKAGNNLLVNVFNVNRQKALGTSVNIDDHVADDFKNYSSAFKNLDEMKQTFKREILDQLKQRDSDPPPATSTTEDRPAADDDDERSYDPLRDYRVPAQNPYFGGGGGVPAVGRGDLNPFGGIYGGGGGMLFDPSNMGVPSRPPLPDFGVGGRGGLPRAAVPPGARFDPIGPPLRGRGPAFPPDPDHLPPPGFGDSFI